MADLGDVEDATLNVFVFDPFFCFFYWFPLLVFTESLD